MKDIDMVESSSGLDLNLLLLSAVDRCISDRCLIENGLRRFPQISCYTFVSTKILLFSGHTLFCFPSVFESQGTSLIWSAGLKNTISCKS